MFRISQRTGMNFFRTFHDFLEIFVVFKNRNLELSQSVKMLSKLSYKNITCTNWETKSRFKFCFGKLHIPSVGIFLTHHGGKVNFSKTFIHSFKKKKNIDTCESHTCVWDSLHKLQNECFSIWLNLSPIQNS